MSDVKSFVKNYSREHYIIHIYSLTFNYLEKTPMYIGIEEHLLIQGIQEILTMCLKSVLNW